MRASEWIQFIALAALLIVSTPIAGAYMAKVYSNGRAPGDRVFGPIERLIYRVCGIDGKGEQRWKTYTISLLSFNAVAILAVYFVQRIQDYLPINPTHVTAVPPFMALNTSVSFVTNTDWQSYVPEVTVSHLTQMAVLGVENFLSAAIGLTVAVALIRGLARRRSNTIGSFWVDLVRSSVRILLPLSLILAVVFLSQGVIDNFHGNTPYKPVDSALVQAKDSSGQPTGSAVVPGGPVASQEAIKELGTNGGGFYNANSGHPFENPNGLTNFLQMYFAALIGFGLTYTFGKMVGDKRQGWAVFAVMLAFWALPMLGTQLLETHGNPQLTAAGASQTATATNPGGNLEGKEVRFGAAASAMHGSNSTSTTTGSVNSSHDSWTPLGGGIVLTNILLGEYGPGGIGSGLYGVLDPGAHLGVHRRAHGRADARVHGQEDPRPRRQARHALRPRGTDRDVGAGRDRRDPFHRRQPARQHGAARPVGDPLFLRIRGQRQRLGVPGHHRDVALVRADPGVFDPRRPVRADRAGTRDRGRLRAQAAGPGLGRNVPDARPTVRRPAVRRDPDPRRAHVLPRALARAHRRALEAVGVQ